jgi:hypothetical protein
MESQHNVRIWPTSADFRGSRTVKGLRVTPAAGVVPSFEETMSIARLKRLQRLEARQPPGRPRSIHWMPS